MDSLNAETPANFDVSTEEYSSSTVKCFEQSSVLLTFQAIFTRLQYAWKELF